MHFLTEVGRPTTLSEIDEFTTNLDFDETRADEESEKPPWRRNY